LPIRLDALPANCTPAMKLIALYVAAACAINDEGSDMIVANANPVRKVVTMLQKIQKKVEAEGQKEKQLHEKFMCYCTASGGELQKSIAETDTKLPQVAHDIKEAESKKNQLDADIKHSQEDRLSAKSAMADATAIKEKEAASYRTEKEELLANLEALTKAIAAIEKGMVGNFLQTTVAAAIRKLVISSQELLDVDRQDVLSFLSNGHGSDYAPKSGEIVGILKEMKETMAKELAKATEENGGSVQSYEELMAAKKKEIEALTASIQSKIVRVGELGVEIVQMKEDLSNSEAALLEDTTYLGTLEKDCATKAKEWEAICKTRAEELVALSETIKVLNDDDALELFKKTLPEASASFVQMSGSSDAVRTRALAMLATSSRPDGWQTELVTLALRGKKVDLTKVMKMIDDMVAVMKSEQVDDNNKKEYCSLQFDAFDDKKKGLVHSISDVDTEIEDAKSGLATVISEMKALEKGIAVLDKSVAVATEQRKQEHADYGDLLASDAAAKELLGFAKNRLRKFYSPKLYKPPPKREMSEEERITVNLGGTLAPTDAPGGIAGTGITVLAQVFQHVHKDVPPPPPETFGPYAKKAEETTGVIAMIDLLIKEIDEEMTEAEAMEKEAQADYEATMKDAAAKRIADTKILASKGAAKADLEADLEDHKESKASTTKELVATLKVVQALHGECDWLLKYFDVRKEARAAEIDSLVKAKAVLSGADFSLVQSAPQFLRSKA